MNIQKLITNLIDGEGSFSEQKSALDLILNSDKITIVDTKSDYNDGSGDTEIYFKYRGVKYLYASNASYLITYFGKVKNIPFDFDLIA